VVSGWQNKLEAAAAHVMPSERLAKKHSEMAAPGDGEEVAPTTKQLPTGTPAALRALGRYGATSSEVDFQLFAAAK
jgi:hypothetical protein